MEPPTFGQWAKKQRTDKGWTLVDLANELAKITKKPADPSLASKIERAKKNPGLGVRARYHAVFGTSEDDLVRERIVIPTDVYGRPLPQAASSPNLVFPVGDDRNTIVELLKQLDMHGSDRDDSQEAIRTMISLLSDVIENQQLRLQSLTN